MSGRLIILGHKSWHPWSKENLNRVERDEEKHAAAQEAELARQRRAQAEERLLELRRRLPSSSPPSSPAAASSPAAPAGEERFTLFPNEGGAPADEGGRRKKRGKGDDAPAPGFGLGESADVQPWYAFADAADAPRLNARGAVLTPDQVAKAQRLEARALVREDPMSALLGPSVRAGGSKREARTADAEGEKAGRKGKKKGKRRRAEEPDFRQLRAEREQRERAERARAVRLVSGAESDAGAPPARGHSSRFNPSFRRPRR